MIKILKDNIFNLISKALLFKKKIIINKDIVKNIHIIDFEHHDTFFGYYDLCPFDIKNKYHLVHRLNKKNNPQNLIEIGLYSIEEKQYKPITRSNLYNFQFGSRLSWYDKDCNYIIYNDSFNNNMLTRIIDKNTSKIIDEINFPFFDYNNSSNEIASTDFIKLGLFRPGYGYKGNYNNDYFKKYNSVLTYNITKKTNKEIISINEADNLNKDYSKLNFDFSYFNHLKFSPDGKFLIFLYVWSINNIRYSTLGIFNFDLNEINFANFDNWNPSHFNFYDNDKIILTINNYKKSQLLLFNLRNYKKNYFINSNINHDFHPHYYGNEFILNDTYPNKFRYQKLNLLNVNNKKNKNIVEVFSPNKFKGINKCDLHPRINNKKNLISLDTSFQNRRSTLILEVNN